MKDFSPTQLESISSTSMNRRSLCTIRKVSISRLSLEGLISRVLYYRNKLFGIRRFRVSILKVTGCQGSSPSSERIRSGKLSRAPKDGGKVAQKTSGSCLDLNRGCHIACTFHESPASIAPDSVDDE